MTRLLSITTIIASLLLLTACGGGSSPVGKWSIDADKTLEASPDMKKSMLEGVPENMKDKAMEQFRSMMSKGSVEFMADGTVKMDNPGGSETGKWTQDGDKITLEGEGDLPDSITLSGDTMVMSGEQNGMTVTMHLVRKKG